MVVTTGNFAFTGACTGGKWNGIGPNGGLNGVLDRLFEEMIPLAGRLIGVAQAIAGFAALWYIAVRGLEAYCKGRAY